MYYQHRLIWEAFHGPIPEGSYIDHINRDRSDNRLANLRLVNVRQSQANRGDRSNNTSGHKWIDWDKSRNKWRVQLTDLSGKKYSKRFLDLGDAILHRDVTAQRLHGEYYYDRRRQEASS